MTHPAVINAAAAWAARAARDSGAAIRRWGIAFCVVCWTAIGMGVAFG